MKRHLAVRVIVIALVGCLSGCGIYFGGESPPMPVLPWKDVMERCLITSEETYMVDFARWSDAALVDRKRASCDEVRVSLVQWRAEEGDDWGFMSNYVEDGPVPSFEGFRALWVSVTWPGEDTVEQSVLVFPEEGVAWSATEVEAYSAATVVASEGAVSTLSVWSIGQIECLLETHVSGWEAIPGWYNHQEGHPVNSSWDDLGVRWWVTVCAEDYSLYRSGSGWAAPSDFVEFFNGVWELVGE